MQVWPRKGAGLYVYEESLWRKDATARASTDNSLVSLEAQHTPATEEIRNMGGTFVAGNALLRVEHSLHAVHGVEQECGNLEVEQ